MDIPFIDDSCASDSSPQRTLPLPCGRGVPLRLSRYSESSEEAEPPPPSRHRGGGDDLSVNNLLDELSGEEVASLGSSPPQSSLGRAASPADAAAQVPESGYSDWSSVPTAETASSLSRRGSLPGPLSPRSPPEPALTVPPSSGLSASESGIYVDVPDTEPASGLCPPDSCPSHLKCRSTTSTQSRASVSNGASRGLALESPTDERCPPESGVADSGVVSPAVSEAGVRTERACENGGVPRPPLPDLLGLAPGLQEPSGAHVKGRTGVSKTRREPAGGGVGADGEADRYPYPLPHPGDPGYTSKQASPVDTPAEDGGGLLQDVLQALGRPRFDGPVHVESSSNVTLGPVININMPAPGFESPPSTAERKDRSNKRSSPFNSIGKASLASSVCSGLERVPPSRQATLRGTNNPLMGRIVSYLRTRCLDTLTRQQPIPWCPEFRLPLQRYYIALGLLPMTARGEQAHLQLPLHQILSPLTVHESPLATCPRRLLVEGEPGFGKSTLMLKLLHDWASEEAPSYLAGFQFAFLIPLWEFSGSLFNFTHRELLPRHIVGRDLMVKLWQFLAENEDKVLFLLDGLDELRDEHRAEVTDLLSGKLFLNSTVVVTSRPSHVAEALPWVQRRLVIQGFEQPSVHCYVEQYFACVSRPCGVARLEAELAARPQLQELARCPLLCLLLCVLFEECEGALPDSEAALYRTLFACLVRRALLRRGERLDGDELPARCHRLLRQFGKIALQVCLEGRVHYTEQEIVNHVDREVLDWGFLTKVVSVSKVQKRELYQPLHRTFTDYLAAQYLASMPDSRSLRQLMAPVLTHLESLDGQPKASHSVMVMLRYLVALLNDGQRRAYQALELLAPLALPARALFSLLSAAGSERLAAEAVATCLGSQRHVLVQTDQTAELRGWTEVLRVSTHHDSLEVVYRPGATSEALVPLLQVAPRRVRAMKLATLLGTDMSSAELQRLGADVALLLQPDTHRYQLKLLELLLQNLDDNEFGRFQPVVDGLCSALPQVPPAACLKLALDMDMSAAQMTQLCEALERAPGVTVLTIHHLVSFDGSMSALAALLRRRPLSALTLSSVWRPDAVTTSAADFFRSEQQLRAVGSGVARGRGTSLTRNYSLGRGAAGGGAGPGELDLAYQLRLGREPICDPETHAGGFHHLFSALRWPGCVLSSLNLSRCRLTAADLACLGESLRVATHLTNLTVRHLTSPQDLVPVLFALQENGRLQLLDLRSSMVIEDAEFILLCRSLACCQDLLLLDLTYWTFKLEWEHSLRAAVEFLQRTGLQELQLEHASFQLSLQEAPRRDDAAAQLARLLPAVRSRLDTVGAGECVVTVNECAPVWGPALLPLVQRLCPRLGAISLNSRPSATTKPLDDAALLRFFRQCADSPRLRQLRLGNWRLQLARRTTLENKLKPLLRRLRVSQVYLGGLKAEADGVSCLHALVMALVTNLRCLQLVSLPSREHLVPAEAAAIGRGLRDRFTGDKLVIYTRFMSYAALRALRSVVEESDKFITSYSGGELGVYVITRVARQAKP